MPKPRVYPVREPSGNQAYICGRGKGDKPLPSPDRVHRMLELYDLTPEKIEERLEIYKAKNSQTLTGSMLRLQNFLAAVSQKK